VYFISAISCSTVSCTVFFFFFFFQAEDGIRDDLVTGVQTCALPICLDEDIVSLKKARNERNDPEIAAHLGEVLWVKGDKKTAQEVWDNACKEAPEDDSSTQCDQSPQSVKNTCRLILLAFFVACSEVPVRPDRGIDLDLQNQREQIQSWKLNGRLSITSERESGTVTFHWSQDDEAYLMSFNAPLGQGTFALRGGEEDGVYLLTAENKILHADNAENILQQTVGWHVP